MKAIEREARACDCCGSTDLEAIWEYTFRSKARHDTYVWDVRNVVCRNCGFAFVSPAPTSASLTAFYSDTYSAFTGMAPDHSVANRVRLIAQHAPADRKATYIEVGSNDCPEFVSALKDLVGETITVEPNPACPATYRSVDELPADLGDLITAYFVLEHVPHPRVFLEACAHALRVGGKMIVEVPDIHAYPREPDGLFLYEHVNHFSPRSLARLAAGCGLALVDISHRYCSRPFGFAAVFKKVAQDVNSPDADPVEYIQARACLSEGAQLLRDFHERAAQARRRIDVCAAQHLPVVVWAANPVAVVLLDEYTLPETAVVVDIDPRKRTYLDPIAVHEPGDVLDHIAHSKLFVLNTRLRAPAILAWIEDKTGRRPADEQVIILDYQNRPGLTG